MGAKRQTPSNDAPAIVPMIKTAIAFAAALGLASADDSHDTLLASVLAGTPAAHHAAIAYLIARMPPRDTGAVSAAYIRQNVELAFKARDEFPWGRQIPEDIFLNDVLPYASLDEARDDWRADFLSRFRKHVTGCRTAREAVTRVNAVVERETRVKYNTHRRVPNQGPRESMSSGMASCTGLSILLVDALRSVALPARIAGTAMWTTKEGNHDWVEVWLPDTKQWHFTEYNPDPAGLDHGWLLADAARALQGSLVHGIYATSWKSTGAHFPMVWAPDDESVPAVDVTRRYIDLGAKTLPEPGTCAVRVEVSRASNGGKPIRQAEQVDVWQGDILIATGLTPGPSDDTNRYFTTRVKQGLRYQIRQHSTGTTKPCESLAIGPKESFHRVTLTSP